jgi:hypothetical protein
MLGKAFAGSCPAITEGVWFVVLQLECRVCLACVSMGKGHTCGASRLTVSD